MHALSDQYQNIMSCHHICSLTECLSFYVYLIVQAPVSDREYHATLPHTASMIDLAAKMISEGRGLELMPREADPSAPITAYRWVYRNILAF